MTCRMEQVEIRICSFTGQGQKFGFDPKYNNKSLQGIFVYVFVLFNRELQSDFSF